MLDLLVIDDDPSIAALMTDLLSEEGYRVTTTPFPVGVVVTLKEMDVVPLGIPGRGRRNGEKTRDVITAEQDVPMQQHDPIQAEAKEHAGDNPAMSIVIERNIRTIIRLRSQAARERSLQDRISDAITSFAGRMSFVYWHVVWFGAWILLNTGHFLPAFDPFPYGLLTMVVSLEAIFLSTFVLISQNRLSEEVEHRADLALQTGLLTEHELTRVLQMLDAIQDKMGIENDADSDLADLEMETRPEDVLAEITRLQQRALDRNTRAAEPTADASR